MDSGGSDAGEFVDPACPPDPGIPKRILFIGNSFTHQGPVPELVRDLATDAGWTTPYILMSAESGYTLLQHRSLSSSTDAIDSGGWDIVVLQDFSTRATDNLGDPAAFKADTLWFYDRIKATSPDADVLLYETWARHPSHSVYPTDFANPAEMQAQLRAHYQDAADNYIPNNALSDDADDVSVVSVGDLWDTHLGSAIAYNLHGGDNYHANALGQYLNALVFYNAIYRTAVTGLATAGRSTSDAARLQMLVDDTLQPMCVRPGQNEVPLQLGESVSFDFGIDQSTGWANLSDPFAGAVAFASNATGQATTTNLLVSVPFQGENQSGLPGNTLGYPGEVSSDVFWLGSFSGHADGLMNPAQVTVRGLATGEYTVALFASRSGDDLGAGRLTRYSIDGVPSDLDAANNTSNIASFATVSPKQNGSIVVDLAVSPAGNARFGYLGALVVTKTAD